MWPWPDSYIFFVQLFWWDCSSAYPCCKPITALRHIPNSIQTCNCQTSSKKEPTSLDPNDKKNKKHFIAVSNLSFFSKLLEKVVMSQLLDHLNTNELWPRFQSTYRACHSTETALLRVLNDLLTASDDGQVSLLTLLDLSAALDTTDHDILFHRLEHVFGIQNSALSFFRSYLTERKQMVSISGYSSNPSTLLHGVH